MMQSLRENWVYSNHNPDIRVLHFQGIVTSREYVLFIASIYVVLMFQAYWSIQLWPFKIAYSVHV